MSCPLPVQYKNDNSVEFYATDHSDDEGLHDAIMIDHYHKTTYHVRIRIDECGRYVKSDCHLKFMHEWRLDENTVKPSTAEHYFDLIKMYQDVVSHAYEPFLTYLINSHEEEKIS